ncbi:MAG: nucleoside hydrolase [Streptosporangiaceae bacterium]
MAIPIILDCDPGHDDALAIVLAAGNPDVDLQAITTVAGNQPLEKTTYNARLVSSLAGISGVPIAAGCSGPVGGPGVVHTTPIEVGRAIHGTTGLDGVTLDAPTVPLVGIDAVTLMRELLIKAPEQLTIVATGPLSNVATLIAQNPEVTSAIREIVCMGGSTDRGNVTPYGEFNVVADPEAYHIVLQSDVKLTLCGLNVTHQILVSDSRLEAIKCLNTPLADACHAWMTFFADTYREVFGMPDPPLHDPIAVARVIKPEIVGCIDVPLGIELLGNLTRGATVVDLHHVTDIKTHAHVATTVDHDGFWSIMLNAIDTLGRRRRRGI